MFDSTIHDIPIYTSHYKCDYMFI